MITLLFHLFRLFPFLWLGYEPSTCPHVTQRSPTETRSEEHTSELQSRLHLVCRLLLEKKKNQTREQCTTRRATNRPSLSLVVCWRASSSHKLTRDSRYGTLAQSLCAASVLIR